MDPYANAGCVLKMNVKCETCITKLMDALTSICGVYTVNIDAEQGTVDISGQVDPNSLLLTLFRSGEHAELVRVKLQHPALGQRSSYHDNNINNNTCHGRLMSSGGYNNYNYNNGNSHGYGINDPYLYEQTRPLLGNYDEQPSYYPWPNDYCSWHNRNYVYDPHQPLPPARYVPSGPPPPECNPYDDQPLSFCSIM